MRIISFLKNKEITVIFTILIISIIFFLPFLKNINSITFDNEWGNTFSYNYFTRKAFLEFHQFPFRSPFLNGGYPSIAHPEDGSLNPFLVASILNFGEIAGTKIFCFIVYIVGAIGMYYLARNIFNYNYLAALFSTLTFSLSSWLPGHLYRGHIRNIYYYLFPLIFIFFIKAKFNKKYILYTALVMLLILFQAGLNFIVTLLFLLLYSVLETIAIDSTNKKIKLNFIYLNKFLALLLVILLLGAIKILPMLNLFKETGIRSFDSYTEASFGSFDLSSFSNALFVNGIDDTRIISGDKISDSGCVMYLGFIPIIIFLVVLLTRFKKNIRWLIILAVFIFICFGPNAPIDLFKIAWHLPLFHSMHKPNKYFTFFILFLISIITGDFFNSINIKSNTKIKNILFLSIILYSCYTQFNFWKLIGKDMFNRKKPDIKENTYFSQAKIEGPEYLSRGMSQYYLLMKNVGTLNPDTGGLTINSQVIPKYNSYIEKNEQLRFINNDSYKGEAYFLEETNKTEIISFTPNKIDVKVSLIKPDKLIINQNFSSFWKTNTGHIINHKGLLGVNLNNDGNYIIKLQYIPKDFYIGLMISLCTLAYFIIIK